MYFHSIELEEYCLIMGRKLGLSGKELELLERLSKYHDIGKYFIDENVLQKAGKLSATDWLEIRKHPHFGSDFMSGIMYDPLLAVLILHHHERWDGKGYPCNLKAYDIPLFDRILSVADAFDAMTNDRFYRKAMDPAKALTELKDNAGKQFDPHMVMTFLACVRN